MTNYKDTLNLPHTDFAMKANLAQREADILAHWQRIDVYGQLQALRQGQPHFILHDGPPYANGQIHIGHALNKILKDTILKAKALSGFCTPFVPGWDCHGLPIELNVEKEVGKPGVKVDATAFRQACRDYALRQIDGQRLAFQRLGIAGDWQQPYLTMAFRYEADIVRSLARIVDNGHLHQGCKPVHWCIECGSSLAEAEVEYQDKQSSSIDVRFAVVDHQALFATLASPAVGEGAISVVIWTTTPWTLPANQAVAIHPTEMYTLVQCTTARGAERLLVAAARVEHLMQHYGCATYTCLLSVPGSALLHVQVQHPFYARQVPLVLGEHVTVNNGTGAVHTAPAHGREDYAVALQYQLSMDSPVDARGRYADELPLLGGERVLHANQRILEILQQHDALLQHTTLTHSYPHCWRHKTPLIFRATPQWFISMEQNGLRELALQAIDKVTWIPDWGQARLAGMIQQRPDWCISRQRTWGVPMAIFVHKKNQVLHPNTPALLRAVAERIEQAGVEAWFALDAAELLGEEAEHYEKLPDVLDVWFDSGVSHASVLERHPALHVPADLYLEGSDQHRGWFQSSLLTSVAMRGSAPYKAVLTHGFTLDGQGRKMSKSLGNVIVPEKVMQTLGADILRLWVASTDYCAEQAISDEILKRTADMYRRLRNTARFLLSNLYDFDPAQHVLPATALLALDRWVIARAAAVQHAVCQDYEQYQLHSVSQRIHHFCTVELGGFYLDVIKDRQYTTPSASVARRSTQTAMYHILEALVRWLAPILSFTAEEIWQHMPGQRVDSVLLTTWYEELFSLSAEDVLTVQQWQLLLELRAEVNKELEQQRDLGHIGAALDAIVVIYADDSWRPWLAALGDELHFVFIASAARLLAFDDAPPTAVTTQLSGIKLQISALAHTKCGRCWHRVADVGLHDAHPTLCGRCVTNVSGSGETRRFV